MLDKKISEKKKSNWTKMKFLSANMHTHGLCVRTQGPCMCTHTRVCVMNMDVYACRDPAYAHTSHAYQGMRSYELMNMDAYA